MKIIITADDFGISKDNNDAIIEALNFGILTNTCIMANGEAFEDAVFQAKGKDNIGIHLNIIEGKSLISDGQSPLADKNGIYNLSFLKMLLKSYDKNFLNEVEKEFRSQIEKIKAAGIEPDWINSHVHTHAIPKIFEIACKLAKEYGIKNIRTQAEIPYYAGNLKRHLNFSYAMNIIKNIILNTFTFINKKTVEKYELYTTENFIGVLYTANMDSDTILKGLKALPKNCTVEIILHPTTNKSKEKNYIEFQTLLNEDLKKKLI